MHPIFNFVGDLFIFFVVIILLYQVYYYWLGGKKHSTVIELKDSIPHVKKSIREFKQSKDKKKKQADKQHADDIANGDAYMLPPKYFAIPTIIQITIGIIILLFVYKFFLEGYVQIEILAESCETIFGLQARFVQELGLFAIYVLCVLYILIQHISYFVYRNQSHHKIKAHWFEERIVYKHKSNLDKPTFANDYFSMFSFLLVLFWTSLPDVRSDLQKLDFDTANQFYHQQCLAEQQKIKEKNSVK